MANNIEHPTITAADVLAHDLQDVCGRLQDEFSAMSGKRLLITGGAGFLGYYLVQSVLRWNDETPGKPVHVTVYDSFRRGQPRWLEGLVAEARTDLRVQEHDVRQPMPAESQAYNYIIHGASVASPTFYRQYPIETMDSNINGLRHLLDYFRSCRDRGESADGFLFFSSSEIYGDPPPEEIPTREDYRGNVSCTGPRACYDEAKRYGETLCVNFARQYDLPIATARPFNNYGPGMKITDRRAPADFANAVINGQDIVLLSDGSPSRTFCYAADAIVGYYKVLVRGRSGEAYNIGASGPEVSVADFAERFVEIGRDVLGYRGRLTKGSTDDADYLVDNPTRRCPNIDKARTELDYDPQVALNDGIRRTLIWCSENRESTVA